MDRCAIFVDAGYLIAEGAKVHVAGSAKRGDVAVEFAQLVERLGERARVACSLPLVRIYWYDGATDGIPRPQRAGPRASHRDRVPAGRS